MKHKFRLVAGVLFACIVGIVLFAFAMFQGDQVSWFLLFGYMPIFIYELIMLFTPLKNWKVERIFTQQLIQAGDTVHVQLAIRRKWPWPIFYCVVEELFSEQLIRSNPPTFHKKKKNPVYRRMKRILFPGMSRQIMIEYRLERVPRGVHSFQGLRLATSDLFGLVKKEYIFPAADVLVVYPNERIVSSMLEGKENAAGAASSNHLHAASNIAFGARAYVPGDRFAAIDWKKTAQMQTPMTKIFEQEAGRDVQLILDACAFEGMEPDVFEASVEIALGLIRNQSNRDGTFLVIGEESKAFVLGKKDEETRILQHLARLELGTGIDFARKLQEELFYAQKSAGIVMITSNLNQMLRQIIQKADVHTASFTIIYVQEFESLGQKTHEIIWQLRAAGATVHVITEQGLLQQEGRGDRNYDAYKK